jgi:hypothetical protein
MNPPRFQIVHYVPNLFLGGRVPVAAIVHHDEGKHRVLVRAEFQPDIQCLGGQKQLVALNRALARIEKEPYGASSAALGPHIEVDELRPVPHGVEAVPWLRERVLPRAVRADGARGPTRATHGYNWLAVQGVARHVHKRFRPDKPNVPKISQLENKNLKPISHWTAGSNRLLLMEPIVPDDLRQDPVEDIATVFGAYRYHLRDEPSVTLAVYMLEGGSEGARVHTHRALTTAAHRVFDTTQPDQRAELIQRVREIGAGVLVPISP